MNTKKIKRIDPLQAGKVFAVIYFVIMLVIFLPIILIMSLVGSSFGDLGALGIVGGLGIGLFVPVFYAIIAFIMGVLMAFVYNATYRFHGGYQIEFEADNDELKEIGKQY